MRLTSGFATGPAADGNPADMGACHVSTRMAKVLLVLGACLLIAGIFDQPRLAAVGGLVVCWVMAEWALFSVALTGFDRWVRLERAFTGPTCLPTVWRDQELEVELALVNRSWFHFPYLEVRDVVPPHLEPPAAAVGERWRLGLGPRSIRRWSYPAVAARVGVARFPGVSCQLTSLAGLFVENRFVAAPSEIRIYPPVAGRRHQPALVKFYNRFLHHGIHVHRKGGTGSELLELRDYVPGDPPQSVAWRPSARREELVTRVFESEVPMRVTVFLDGSASMRVGSRQTHLEIATEMIGEFARLALANRDWVGLTLIDESGEELVRPGRGRGHLFRILDLLTRHGNLSAGHAIGDFAGLFQAAEAYAQVRFPGLWDKPFNRSTAGWIPFPGTARRTRAKRLALIAASHLGEGPRLVERCLHDPAAFAGLLARFCREEGLRLRKGFSEEVLDLGIRCAGKLDVLERSLRWSVQRARDNELLVLLVDFAGLEDRLGPILESLRLARRKHHSVIALSPWLSEYFQEVPTASGSETRILRGPFGADGGSDPLQVAERLTYQRYVRSQEAVRNAFLASGVPFAVVGSQEALPRLLAHVSRARLNLGVMS